MTRRMTVPQFQRFCVKPGWTRETETDEWGDRNWTAQVEARGVRAGVVYRTRKGWSTRRSTKKGVRLEYHETYTYVRGDRAKTLKAVPSETHEWILEGVELVTENGAPAAQSVVQAVGYLYDCGFFEELPRAFTHIDYEKELAAEKAVQLEGARSSPAFRVKRTGDRDLSFGGPLLECVGSLEAQRDAPTSVTLTLFRTVLSRIVYKKEFRARWPGAETIYVTDVYENLADFVKKLERSLADPRDGNHADRWLEKELLERAIALR